MVNKGISNPRRISFIGTGRVGCALAIAFQKAGHIIVNLYSKPLESAHRAARFLDQIKVVNGLDQAIQGTEILIISVPDHAYKEWASCFSELEGLDRKMIIANTSGIIPSSQLRIDNDEPAFLVGSIHPMMSFAEPLRSAERLAGIYFAIEGDEEAIKPLSELVLSIDAKPIRVDSRRKPLYHAACIFASNFPYLLAHQAKSLLEICELEPPGNIIGMIASLMRETVENIAELEIDSSLTGPIPRGDFEAIKMHLEELENLPVNDENKVLAELYKQLSIAYARMASKKGYLDAEILGKLWHLLRR